ncbi:uncharacterized protein LOC142570445 [Dermacentor variabilis]|uniref:uncharacterized protein LOC142570445 n=1 Tax=Dermacentor variabilis TaxID=34621 RepID=UPI003F5CB16E
MPTNAELCKKIERLESLLEGKLDSVVEEIAARIVQKLEEQGPGNISELADSVRFISQQYEDMRTTFDGLSATNKALTAQNESLTKRIASMEQYSRLNNIEIKGIPSTQGEDCSAILSTVAESIDCPIDVADIDTVHRVASKSPNKNLIVRFCSRVKKNDFLRKARKARLRTSMIGLSGNNDSPIYVNEHLTFENKRLFSRALALKKQHKWQFLWTDNCQIKARKTENSKVFFISSESDLSVIT